jgi:uncharacterized protein with PQ loop repeat
MERNIKNDTDRLLHGFITEDMGLAESEYDSLTEEGKISTVKEIASQILRSVSEKAKSINMTPIDRSHGDIKRISDIDDLQSAITQLQGYLAKAQAIPAVTEAEGYIKSICKTIMYLNQYSAQFKEAYAQKKSIMILTYESLVCSIFSAVAYLISAAIDFSLATPGVRQDFHIERISPIKSVESFNKSVESGEFKLVLRDLSLLRESFDERTDKDPNSITEASDIITSVLGGLKNMYDSADSDGRLTGILYKTAGAIQAILGLRDIFYSAYQARSKTDDVIGIIKGFTAATIGKAIAPKISALASRFAPDMEQATELAGRTIDTENHNIISTAREETMKPAQFVKAGDLSASPSQISSPVSSAPASNSNGTLDF